MSIQITPELLADWENKAQSYVEWENVKGEHENPRYFSDKASFEQIATPDVVLALVAEIERLNFALDELLCQFDYQNNPKWRAEMKEAMIEMAKKKQDMRQLSGNETNFVSKSEVKE